MADVSVARALGVGAVAVVGGAGATAGLIGGEALSPRSPTMGVESPRMATQWAAAGLVLGMAGGAGFPRAFAFMAAAGSGAKDIHAAMGALESPPLERRMAVGAAVGAAALAGIGEVIAFCGAGSTND
jgi:hypothetical protein